MKLSNKNRFVQLNGYHYLRFYNFSVRNRLHQYMKYIVFFSAILACHLPSCKPAVEKAGPEAPDHHTSQIALDWAGTYTGTTPCADCDGIGIIVKLNQDGTYILELSYQEGSAVIEKEGRFTWNDDGNSITLEGIEEGPNYFLVGENKLIQLDREGQRITGTLTDQYILMKLQ
jgi:copper homeostasis protein (lipoprotein)